MLYSGLDLGTAKDFTALAVLDRLPLGDQSTKRRWRYECRWLQTWELGKSYVDIAKGVKQLFDKPQLKSTTLVADYTGVGRPVVDQLRANRTQARIIPVLTTGGKLVHKDEKTGTWNVPKTELVSTLQVLLQAGLVKIDSRLLLADRLTKELQDYRVTITRARNETFGTETDSQHDDLVFALMLACWLGERDGGGNISGIGLPAFGEGSVIEQAIPGTFARDVKIE